MKRTNISLTEEQYEKLREEGHNLGLSMSAIVRHALDWYWEINTKTETLDYTKLPTPNFEDFNPQPKVSKPKKK